MNILALDLGTKTGWAVSNNGVIKSGTWVLGTRDEVKKAAALRLDRRHDPRFIRLLTCIKDWRRAFPYIEWMIFERSEERRVGKECRL